MLRKMNFIRMFFLYLLTSIALSCNQSPLTMLNTNDEINSPQDGVKKTLNIYNGKKIYIRAKVWGVSGNHEEIIFSENPITMADKERDYVFYTDEVFYKITGDTLSLYVCDTSEPISSFEGVTVLLNDLTTSSQIKDYSENYQKYGLEKMSVYGSVE